MARMRRDRRAVLPHPLPQGPQADPLVAPLHAGALRRQPRRRAGAGTRRLGEAPAMTDGPDITVRKMSAYAMVPVDDDGTPLHHGERMVEISPGEWADPLTARALELFARTEGALDGQDAPAPASRRPRLRPPSPQAHQGREGSMAARPALRALRTAHHQPDHA